MAGATPAGHRVTHCGCRRRWDATDAGDQLAQVDLAVAHYFGTRDVIP